MWRRYKQQRERVDGPVPCNPPRKPASGEDILATDTSPRGRMVGKDDLDPELRKELVKIFKESWPPEEQTVNDLQTGDVVVFAVESGNYTETRQELITAKVLSVNSAEVRARVLSPVAHAEHYGSHAGHGFRVGDLVEVPGSRVLVAARRTEPIKEGYGSMGKPAATLKPSSTTKEIYKVRPGTPYDLILPYRTGQLGWYLDEKLVKLVHLGGDGLLEQVIFGEDSLRGEVSVRLLDEDPTEGVVFVARWDFALEA